MALKSVLDKLDGLPADVSKEYKKGEDGKFHLDVEDFDAHPSALKLKEGFKTAKDHEKNARQAAETKLKEIQTTLDTLTEERDGLLKGAIPKGDVDKLENSYKTKLATREKELTGQIEGLSAQLNEMLVDNVAHSMASEISTAPKVILPHIKGRLKVEKGEDGKFVTKVLDGEGKPSASTLDDLKKEMIANKDFAAIVIGSKASGGGAGGGQGGGGASGSKLDYSKASPKEIAADIKARQTSGA